MTKVSSQMQILLADDNIIDKTIFERTLKGTGIDAELLTFNTGFELMEYLQTADPDRTKLVFLDLNMPQKDGKLCLKEIRNNHDFDNMPVVIFTGTLYLKDIKDTYECGANLYVPKNVFIKNSIKVLAMILDSALNKTLLSPSAERYVLSDSDTLQWV